MKEGTVRRIRLKHRLLINRHHPHARRPAGHLSVKELAKKLAVAEHWIYYQIESGRLIAKRDAVSGFYLLPDHPDTVAKLQKLKSREVQIVHL